MAKLARPAVVNQLATVAQLAAVVKPARVAQLSWTAVLAIVAASKSGLACCGQSAARVPEWPW